MSKRKALGKGLSALIPNAAPVDGDQAPSFFQCPVHAIEPNASQPRKSFDHPEFEELVASVREKGILTPLLVSRTTEGYRLIAGERRWRAAQKAGPQDRPCGGQGDITLRSPRAGPDREYPPQGPESHRGRPRPISSAWKAGPLTQDALAKRLGKDRTTITNMLRLLTLPPLSFGRISWRTVWPWGTPASLPASGIPGISAPFAISSSRRACRCVRPRAVHEVSTSPVPSSPDDPDNDYLLSLADTLKRSLGTKVEIQRRGRRGKITIHFYSDDELEGLLDRFS